MDRFLELFNSIKRPETGPVSAIIAGLGNPGSKYSRSRHNAGFMCVDYIAEKLGFKVDRLKFKSLCRDCELGGRRVLIMKPDTFMNNSGEAVREAAAFYKIEPSEIYVLYDDISLEPGRMRIRAGGSAGGHNGVKDIIRVFATDKFPRVKIGVGSPPPEYDLVDWVLAEIPQADREGVYKCVANTFSALEMMLAGETERAMNLYNRTEEKI